MVLNQLHDGQLDVLSNCKRFNVLCCGRRWGKTVLAEELLLDESGSSGCLAGYPVAYFAPTYRMLMEVWRTILDTCSEIIYKKSETERRVEIYGGGVIDF